MATGIDGLANSLLGKNQSIREENRKNVKRARKEQQKMAVFNGLLRFADGAIQEKHNDWFQNEDSRVVGRLLAKQQKLATQRQQYKDDLDASNKSDIDYEISLVENELDDDAIGNRIEGWGSFSDPKKRSLLYGTGELYDPEKDNVLGAGLYRTIARQRLDARNLWGSQLDNLDPATAAQAWKKVNPNSKNLIGGALSFLKRTFSGTASENNEKAVETLLAEIKSDTAKYEEYKKMRTAGFDISSAIKNVNSKTTLTDREKLGEIVGVPQFVTNEIKTSEPYEFKGVIREREVTKKVVQLRTIYKDAFGNLTPKFTSIQDSDVGKTTNTGEKITSNDVTFSAQQESKTSQKYTESETHPLTNVKIEREVTVFFRNNEPYQQIVRYLDPAAQKIALNPALNNIDKTVLTNFTTQANSIYPSIVRLGDDQDINSVEAYLKTFAGVSPESDAAQYELAANNFSGNTLLVSEKIKSFGEELGFTESDINKIAMQVNFIDMYAREELSELDTRKNLNGLSTTTENVDTSKILLAIDLLRANGSFAKFRPTENQRKLGQNGDLITSQSLSRRLNSANAFAGEESFVGNPLNVDNERFFDSGEVNVIKLIRKKINKLDGAGRAFNNLSILDTPINLASPTEKNPDGSPKSLGTFTAYSLMLGEVINSSGDPVAIDFSKVNEPAVDDFNATNQDTTRPEKTVGELASLINFLIPGTKFDPFKPTENLKEVLIENYNLKDGDSITLDTGNKDRFGKPVTQEISFNLEALGNGQVTVDRQAGAALAKRDYNPLTLDQIPEGPIKSYLSDLKLKFQENISKLKDLGMSGEELTSISTAGLGTEARRLKSINGSILRQLNIESSTKFLPGTLLPGVRNIANRDERLNFFMEGIENNTSENTNSLLSKPINTELENQNLTLPNADSSVSDKLTFVANALGDGPNERAMMQELIWVESKDGTDKGTYEIDSKGQGSFGIAQVDRKAFNQVQKKINKPNSKYADVAASFKENAGIDLSDTKYEDLNDDLLSIIYGRLYLAQITDDPIPDTVEGRANYWKKYFNTKAGKGTTQKYIDDVSARDKP